MRLGSLRATEGARVVIWTPAGWLAATEVLGPEDPRACDMIRLIENWDEVSSRLREAERAAVAGSGRYRLLAADEDRLSAPVPAPRRVLCIGRNYAEHARELGNEPPKAPEIFLRLPATLIGPRDDIGLPPDCEDVDLEAELCAVVGRGGRRIPRERALDAVFGWTVLNDVSVRSWQHRGSQWTPGKNFDRTAPCGPYVVTRDELQDIGSAEVWSAIDGFEMQRAPVSHMMYDIAALVADISSFTTLEPGDLIATGTPPGVGAGRTPPRWLRPGEEVRCGVQGVGELRNRCSLL